MTVPRNLPWFVALLAVAALTSACGGSSAAGPSATTGSTASPTARPDRFAGRGGFPGVNGLVAAVEGTTLQVQGDNQQTAVSWTSSTRFSLEKAATFADVTVGSCVVVRPPITAGATPSTTTSPTGVRASVTAGSVAIEPAGSNGTCAGGFGPRGGGFGGQRPTGAPTGTPAGSATRGRGEAPTGRAGRGPGGAGFGAFGKVTGEAHDSFTVVTAIAAPRGGASATSSPTTAATRTVTVDVTPSTTYTTQVRSSAKAAVVGSCVSAQGSTDDTGALTATTIAVRKAVGGQCRGTGQGGPRG